MCTRKGYAASVSQLTLATAALYFPLLILHSWGKRSAAQPWTIYSEVPKYRGGNSPPRHHTCKGRRSGDPYAIYREPLNRFLIALCTIFRDYYY